MKRAFIFLLLSFIIITAAAQPKTRGKVKRKYRDVERVSENLPQVVFRGIVRDIHKNPIPGASVEIQGIKRLVHSNEFGRFMLTDLPTGRLRLKVSCIGYRTKTIDFVLQQGYNDHYVALDREPVHLETIISSAQKREKHIPDIPASASVITESFAGNFNVIALEGVTEFIPSFDYEQWGAGKAGVFLDGSNGSGGFSEISPSVAVYSDGVPAINPAAVSSMFFDSDRVEVIKGAQNSLFGRNAIGGALNVISKKPDNRLNGYITAGGGNFGTKEARAAINVPVINKMLFIRAAGIYSSDNGFVENTLGGTLNGKDNYGGRFSLRFLPAYNHKLDIDLNYFRKDYSGLAFMNPWFQMEENNAEDSPYTASLTLGDQLGSGQELMNGTLNYRYFISEHNYLTLISSYRKSNASDVWDADGTALAALEMEDEQDAELFYQELRYNFSRKSNASDMWDADGTALAALEMEDEQNAELFYQELRYNFSRKSRLNGSAGVSYSSEKKYRRHGISSHDQLIYDILNAPGNTTMPAESPFPFYPQPLNPAPMADFQFTSLHHEENIHDRRTQSAQAYLHFTYRLNEVLFFTGGVRGFYERMQLAYESLFTGGAESSLGQFSGSSPNLLYRPSGEQQMSENFLSVAGEAIVTYRWNENFNFFVKAARGRKPQVLLFSRDSQPLVLKPETVNGAEAGLNWIIKQRIYWNLAGFYKLHSNVHAIQWNGSEGKGVLTDNGNATSYGVETAVKAAVIKGVDIFGNYAWMHSEFDSTGVDGTQFIYAGNSFSHAPQHSFSAGISAKTEVIKDMHLFIRPWYSWKSQFWFTEPNSSSLVQSAYGLLNLTAGIELDNPRVILSVYGTNLLDQYYKSSGGYWGALFGIPTVVPGAPRMLGAKMTWSF